MARELDAAVSAWQAQTGDRQEPPEALAGRLMPGHRDCHAPQYTGERGRAARKDPSLRRVRPPGLGI